MVLISGDQMVAKKEILISSNFNGKIKRSNAGFVKKIGFSIGGVSLIIASDNLPILIDPKLKKFKVLWASVGHTH